MDNKKLLRIGEASKYLGVSIDTLRRWDDAGKLKPFRLDGGNRYYRIEDLEVFIKDIRALAKKWVTSASPFEPDPEFHCINSAVFQARIIKLQNELSKRENLENIYSLIVAVAGEIGNNSYDHNLGSWPDIGGVFFGFDTNKRIIVLADRGQGILKTLQRVKPNLHDDKEALKTAFTEIISGRAPENRGNGLKFVRRVVSENPLKLLFSSGDAILKIEQGDSEIKIFSQEESFHGCLAIIEF